MNQAWWLMPVILANQQVEVRRITVRPAQAKETTSQPIKS
jgi:hypothetical protein